jgi:hypothetical protein
MHAAVTVAARDHVEAEGCRIFAWCCTARPWTPTYRSPRCRAARSRPRRPSARRSAQRISDMLTRRFITDREGIGKTTKAPLASHWTNAMGCSELAEARKLMSDEYKAMLDN